MGRVVRGSPRVPGRARRQPTRRLRSAARHLADLGEVRTLAVHDDWRGRGVGHRLLTSLEADARDYGLTRLFCLTFEVDFFARHGFTEMGEELVDPDTYAELVRSSDEGIAELLDLARVKPNTLGNFRMIKQL